MKSPPKSRSRPFWPPKSQNALLAHKKAHSPFPHLPLTHPPLHLHGIMPVSKKARKVRPLPPARRVASLRSSRRSELPLRGPEQELIFTGSEAPHPQFPPLDLTFRENPAAAGDGWGTGLSRFSGTLMLTLPPPALPSLGVVSTSTEERVVWGGSRQAAASGRRRTGFLYPRRRSRQVSVKVEGGSVSPACPWGL